jgi:hypothetical protein
LDLKKNNSFIEGALTQKRAFKQLEGALKYKTVKITTTKEIKNLGRKH